MLTRWEKFDKSAAVPLDCRRLKDPAVRKDMLSLAGEFVRYSAIRRLSVLSRRLDQCGPLPPAEAEEFINDVFYDFGNWNTEIPPWKMEILNHYRSRLLALGEIGADLAQVFKKVSVTFTFKPSGHYEKLWLKGSWNADGRLDHLGGWADLPLHAAGNGTWTRQDDLGATRANDLYHAVVRTGKWPAGESIGYAHFRADSAARVEISPLPLQAAGESAQAVSSTPSVSVGLVLVDGATWQVILPLVYMGKLPHFRKLLDEGAVADLVSTGKYETPFNAFSAYTGKLPFRHGVTAEEHYQPNTGRKASPLWKMASDSGRSSLIVCLLDSFPPDVILGKVVTDAFFAVIARRQKGVAELALSAESRLFAQRFGVSAEGIRGFLKLLGWIDGTAATTYPPELEQDLRRRLTGPSEWGFSDLSSLMRYIDDRAIRAVDYLTGSEHFDLAAAYISETDTASHQYWGSFESPVFSFKNSIQDPRVRTAVDKLPPSEGRLEQAYQRADNLIGLMMRRSQNLIIFSDHGFGSAWTDYLYLEFSMDKFLDDFGKKTGLALPAQAQIAGRSTDITLWLPATSEGRAYASRLTQCLKDTRYLPHGSAMFSEISVAAQGGRLAMHFFQDQPKPMFINGVSVEGTRHSVMDFFDLSTLQGLHKGNGIIAVWGPRIRPGRMAQAYIPDVAPTALYLLDLPTARDMDGAVIEGALREAELARRPIQYVAGYGSGGSNLLRLLRAIRWREALSKLGSPIFSWL